MPSTAHTTAAARTALHILRSLRAVTGKTAALKELNAAIDTAIAVAERLLAPAEPSLK